MTVPMVQVGNCRIVPCVLQVSTTRGASVCLLGRPAPRAVGTTVLVRERMFVRVTLAGRGRPVAPAKLDLWARPVRNAPVERPTLATVRACVVPRQRGAQSVAA